jgi:hypothetical protein
MLNVVDELIHGTMEIRMSRTLKSADVICPP